MPIPSLQLQKKIVLCREAEGLVTELWSQRSVIPKDSKIEEITPIFQIEDANSASHPPVVQIEDIHVARVVFQGVPSRRVLPFCPFWLHTFICLNSPELHCWLSSHPHCIKMLGLCFRVYVRRSQGAGTDPAKDSMPRACRRGQGLPSDLPKDSLCLHLVVIDCKFVVRKVFGMTLPKTACPGHAIELDALKYPILSALRKGTDFLQTQWVTCMALPHMWNKKKGALIKPWPPRN